MRLLEELEKEILARNYWDIKLLNELAWYADMESEWETAEEIEPMVYEMAEKAGIKVIL